MVWDLQGSKEHAIRWDWTRKPGSGSSAGAIRLPNGGLQA